MTKHVGRKYRNLNHSWQYETNGMLAIKNLKNEQISYKVQFSTYDFNKKPQKKKSWSIDKISKHTGVWSFTLLLKNAA